MEKVNLDNAQVNILIELNGDLHMVAMKKEKLGAATLIIKSATEHLVRTGRTQNELLEFLNHKG